MPDLTADELETQWETSPRWNNVVRDYGARDVLSLRGPIQEDSRVAEIGAEELWKTMNSGSGPPVRAVGALNGVHAVQLAKTGVDAIYISGMAGCR